jgi:hypothetical protein
MKEDVKDVAIRTGKTFIATFLASLSVQVGTVNDVNTAKAALLAAVAAGITAAINIAIKAFTA